jgi:hypothetical protein
MTDVSRPSRARAPRSARARWTQAGLPLAVFGLLAALPSSALAQADEDEPVLAQVREAFSQPGLTLGFLLQAVVDAGLEDDPASAQVAAARIRVSGVLDGGFSYRLQTNHAASPSLLDAQVGWTQGPRLAVHAGRFKTPFSREFLTYAGSIDFVNRSRVVSALAPNRQIGVQASGLLTERIGYAVGGFTGGSNTTPNEALVGVARLSGAGFEVAEGVLGVAAHVAVGRDGAIGTRVLGPGFLGEGLLLGADARFEAGRLLLAGEYAHAAWDPLGPAEPDAAGFYLTAGWMLAEARQALVRWDRYRAPIGPADDIVLLGFNVWPTEASEIQINWGIPVDDTAGPHKLVVNFQVGF